MTHNPPPVPPFSNWPTEGPADCWLCERPDNVVWLGTAPLWPPLACQEVHWWDCRACKNVFFSRVTCWPVLDGPDCPVCETPDTRWQGIDPDHLGDLWACEAGHEFVLDPEGLIYVPPAGGEGC